LGAAAFLVAFLAAFLPAFLGADFLATFLEIFLLTFLAATFLGAAAATLRAILGKIISDQNCCFRNYEFSRSL